MDLWIRSQDKRRLTKINSINIDNLNPTRIIANYIYTSRENYEFLGRYISEERALEVLNDIYLELANGNNHDDRLIFPMPKA